MNSNEERELFDKLSEKEKKFCSEYILDWNQTRSYRVAYPNTTNDNSAAASANKLLRKPKIEAYIKHIKRDLEKQAGISRLMVINEFKKIAFSSVAHLHNTWITRKEFEQLTDEQKDCIESIDVKVSKNEESGYETEQVKIKLYDKQKALDSINKMLGYNEPEMIEAKVIVNNLETMSTEELINRAKALKKLEDEK